MAVNSSPRRDTAVTATSDVNAQDLLRYVTAFESNGFYVFSLRLLLYSRR